MVELYLHSPICLHGIVLNELSKGTTLSLRYSTIRRIRRGQLCCRTNMKECDCTNQCYEYRILCTELILCYFKARYEDVDDLVCSYYSILKSL
jgi:hypothetical protein